MDTRAAEARYYDLNPCFPADESFYLDRLPPAPAPLLALIGAAVTWGAVARTAQDGYLLDRAARTIHVRRVSPRQARRYEAPAMKATTEIDAVREEAILSSLAGFPFLLVYSVAWIAAAVLSYLVPSGVAPWIYLLGGMPAAPIAIALERRVGYVHAPNPDPLLPLTLQILFVQIVAIPSVMIVWSLAPNYVPVAFAAVVGGHFLPFQWVYRTRLYGFLGVAVAGGSYLVGALSGEQAIHYTGFFVGATLLVGAFLARSHARATWLESQRAAQTGDV